MNLLSVVGFLFLLYKMFTLNSRVNALENRLRGVKFQVVKKGTNLSSETQPVSAHSSPQEEDLTETPHDDHAYQKKEEAYVYSHELGYFERFVSWYKQDWMLKTGAFLMLLGMGWFVTYAFMENWIGPLGRITLGFALGIAFLLYGWNKMRDTSFVKKAAVFFVVGASIIILTAYSARAVYEMFSAVTVIGIIFAVSAVTGLSAVRFLPTLGYAGLFMGGIAPLLSSSSENNYVLLFSYLLVIVLGSHIVVHLTGKRGIILGGLLMVSFYSIPYVFDIHSYERPKCHWVNSYDSRSDYNNYNTSYNNYNYNYNNGEKYVCDKATTPAIDYGVLLLFAYAFAMISFLASIIGILVSVKEKTYELMRSDLLTGIGTGMFLIAWITRAAEKDFQSLILTAWTFVFVIGAYLLFMKVKERGPFYVYALVGIILLGVATAKEFEGIARLVAFALEASATVLGSLYLLRDKKVATTMTGFFIVPMIFSLDVLSRVRSAFDTYSIALFFFSFALLFISYALYRKEHELDEEKREYTLFKVYLIVGSIYFWSLVWMSMNLLSLSNGTTISLIIYTVSGLLCYAYGKQQESKGVALYGSVLAGIVVAHLLFIDVWHMDLFGKVVTFFSVGGLLMLTAYSAKKK